MKNTQLANELGLMINPNIKENNHKQGINGPSTIQGSSGRSHARVNNNYNNINGVVGTVGAVKQTSTRAQIENAQNKPQIQSRPRAPSANPVLKSDRVSATPVSLKEKPLVTNK